MGDKPKVEEKNKKCGHADIGYRINRELRNKNKCVFERTYICLYACLCALSKSVFFCHVNILFG